MDEWTLVGWTASSLPAATAAAILGAQILIAHDGPSQTFQRYAAVAPTFLNTLQTVQQGAGLWVFRHAAGAAAIPAPPTTAAPRPLLSAAVVMRSTPNPFGRRSWRPFRCRGSSSSAQSPRPLATE